MNKSTIANRVRLPAEENRIAALAIFAKRIITASHKVDRLRQEVGNILERHIAHHPPEMPKKAVDCTIGLLSVIGKYAPSENYVFQVAMWFNDCLRIRVGYSDTTIQLRPTKNEDHRDLVVSISVKLEEFSAACSMHEHLQEAISFVSDDENLNYLACYLLSKGWDFTMQDTMRFKGHSVRGIRTTTDVLKFMSTAYNNKKPPMHSRRASRRVKLNPGA